MTNKMKTWAVKTVGLRVRHYSVEADNAEDAEALVASGDYDARSVVDEKELVVSCELTSEPVELTWEQQNEYIRRANERQQERFAAEKEQHEKDRQISIARGRADRQINAWVKGLWSRA